MPRPGSLKSRIARAGAQAALQATAPSVQLPQMPKPGFHQFFTGPGNQLGNGSKKQKQKAKKALAADKRQHANGIVTPSSKPNVTLTPAPIAFGTSMSNVNDFKMGGKPQPNSRYQAGIRVVGSGFFFYGTAGTTSGVPTDAILTTAASNLSNVFNDTGAASDANWVRRLTPSTMSLRLGLQATIYRFYAIRDLTITYVPVVSTATNGSVAFAIIRDPYQINRSSSAFAAESPRTPEGLVCFQPSCMTPVWEPCTLRYKFNGPEVFSIWSATQTDSDLSGDVGEHIQLLLGASASGLGASQNIGRLMIKYTVDFYQPGTALITSAISAHLDPAHRDPRFDHRMLKGYRGFPQQRGEPLKLSSEVNSSLVCIRETDSDEEKERPVVVGVDKLATPTRSKSSPPLKK
jgi:hypothetical protein